MESVNDAINNSIMEFRKKNGKTQAYFAEIIGKTRQSVQAKESPENSKNNYSIEEIVAIADHFNVSIDSLIGRTTIKWSLTLSEVLEIIFRASKESDVYIINQNVPGPYGDTEENVMGFAICMPEWNKALKLWKNVIDTAGNDESGKELASILESHLLKVYADTNLRKGFYWDDEEVPFL